MSTAPDAATSIPVHTRVHLTHAMIQFVADREGIDVLHVKGPALHPELLQRDADGQPRPRLSTDADVLVRPGDARRLMRSLGPLGWHQKSSFTSGSPFEHAANVWHDHLGHADIHRIFPGLTLSPAAAFDALWRRRDTLQLAHRACQVPCLDDQRLILLLHAARSGHPNHPDKRRAWDDADAATRAQVRARAADLGAELALAAAIGELDQFKGRRGYLLWHQFSSPQQHSRIAEWVARLDAARGPRQIASVLVRSVLVNRDRLAMDLGHEPTTSEVLDAWRDRQRRAMREIRARLRGRQS